MTNEEKALLGAGTSEVREFLLGEKRSGGWAAVAEGRIHRAAPAVVAWAVPQEQGKWQDSC